METEVRALEIIVENVKGIEHATLRLRRMPPGQGQLIVLTGENGAGKTSLLRAIDGLLSGGHRTDLIRDGATKSRISMILSDGTEIERTITLKGSYPKVTPPEGIAPPKGIETYFKSLASGFGFDPLAFISKPEKRLDYLMKVMPLEFASHEISIAVGKADKLGTFPAGDLDINGVNRLIKDLIECRGRIGSRRDEKANSVETFRKSLLQADRGDTPRDWKKELGELERSKATIEESDRSDTKDIEGQLREVRDQLSSAIVKLDSDARDEFSRLLGVARNGILNETPENTSGKLFGIFAKLCETSRNLNIAAKAAQDAIDKIHADTSAALQGMAAAIEGAKAGAEQQTKDSGIREEMEKLRKETQALSKDWDTVAAAIKNLETLRRSKLKELPVDGLEVLDCEIYMNGRQFDAWNKGQQILYALQIGGVGAGELGLLIADELEALGPANMKLLEQGVKESGLTLIVTRVATPEEVDKFGPGLRSEPAQALVLQ